jgi:O-antigen/teichoic acid export membrane protein
MNTADVKRQVILGTASSYVLVALRMVLGLITFRLLYQGLSREEFGFWSVLWSVFGYGILMDFGFGLAAQRSVALLSVKKDWQALSHVLSTIFYFYFISAAVIVIVGYLSSGFLINIFQVSDANRPMFERALVIFLAGMGFAFPMGIFPEVLRGQQRLLTANYISMVSMITNAILIALAIWLKWGFITILVLALSCILLPDIVSMILALRHMPDVRLRPSFFSRRQIYETSRFSLFAYLNTLSNVLVNKTDQLVVGTLLSVKDVAPYQAAGKVGEMFHLMTRQLAEVVSPAAAHFHATGDKTALRDMLVQGMRWSVGLATPLYLVTAFHIEGLLRLLTGEPEPARITVLTGHVLLVWYWSIVTTHLMFKKMFIMAGQERRMMRHGVLEATANVVLSVLLTLWLRNILGVALGSLIPTVLFGWLLLWPWAAKEADLSPWRLFNHIVLSAFKGCLPMLAACIAFRFQPWWDSGSTTLLMLLEGGFVTAIGMAGIWRLTLSHDERVQLHQRLARKFGKHPPPDNPPPPTPPTPPMSPTNSPNPDPSSTP